MSAMDWFVFEVRSLATNETVPSTLTNFTREDGGKNVDIELTVDEVPVPAMLIVWFKPSRMQKLNETGYLMSGVDLGLPLHHEPRFFANVSNDHDKLGALAMSLDEEDIIEKLDNQGNSKPSLFDQFTAGMTPAKKSKECSATSECESSECCVDTVVRYKNITVEVAGAQQP